MDFVTNLQSAKQVVPAVAAFNGPAPRLESWVLLAFLLLFAAGLDVCDVSSSLGRAAYLGVIVAFVVAEMLAGLSPWRRPPNHDGVQRGIELLHVVPVGASKRDGQWNAVRIGKHMPLGAQFAAIRRVGAGLIPPLTGADTVALSINWNRQSIPRSSS